MSLDGKANALDAAMAKAVSLHKITPDEVQRVLLDGNGDGKINASDAALIKAVSLQKIALNW